MGVPIVLNYALLSWRAPGLNADENAWLGFFANYVGLISAVCIALYQQYNQRKKDKEVEHRQRLKEEEQERKTNRSYLVLHDFRSNPRLNNIATPENSRLIETKGYQWLIEKLKTDGGLDQFTTSFIKLSHYGNPEVIFNCKVEIKMQYSKGKGDFKVDIGVFEKGIEVFIPVVPIGTIKREEIEISEVKVTYTTIKDETMEYVHDLIKRKDSCRVFYGNHDELLFEFQLDSSSWIYPNKLITR